MADTPRVTVPVEPTADMMACAEQASQMLDWQIKASWSAMLSAAPAPEGGAGIPSSWSTRYQGIATREEAPASEAVGWLRAELIGRDDSEQLCISVRRLRELLRAQPPAREIDIHEIEKAAYKRGWNDREDDIIERAERIAPQAREDAQPVGIVDGLIGRLNTAELDDGTPLYTHPAPDALREDSQAWGMLADLVSWFTKPVQGQNGMVWVIPAGDQGADDAVAAALAALQAEQGAK